MPTRYQPDSAIGLGRREHRKRVTRRELIVAGRRLFSEQGVYDVRIEDLARYAGIAKGTVYGYYANKEEVIEAVMRSGLDELLACVRNRTDRARTSANCIRRAARAHLEFFAGNPDMLRVFHQVRGLLEVQQPRWRGLRRAIAEYLLSLDGVLSLAAGVNARTEGRALLLFGSTSGIASIRAALGARGIAPREQEAIARGVESLVLTAHGAPRPLRPRRLPAAPHGRRGRRTP